MNCKFNHDGLCIYSDHIGTKYCNFFECDHAVQATNADRIRAMNDYELAEFLAYKWEPESKAWMREYGETLCWLTEPAEEERHG